ncbi:uncharacterized protein LOC100871902 isoform X2 [Apis florea]|uniref:uncharacterized protein LOC100871902 isoform X2 n=1 Tax=Apis florea TaxID=7463 RepID=UPI0012FF12F1|nr:uncharacterized protein LOC100871902 isoform X2 [Apis florea]
MISFILQSATCSLTKNVILFNEKFTILPCLKFINVRDIHLTSNIMKEFRSGSNKIRADIKAKKVLMEGEKTIDLIDISKSKLFPDASTPYQFFDGIQYDQLHVINIKSSPNNTIMSLTDFKGLGMMLHSAGFEGFKNTKKGTNIAAQQAAITFGTRVLNHGIKTVKLRIQGIGPGRMDMLCNPRYIF